MKANEIVILSGKGGTGKTVLSAAFAALQKDLVIADCDVDAADLHLLLNPVVRQTGSFRSGVTAVIAPDKCLGCLQCRELCRFGAIGEDCIVDSLACEGCGFCSHICPSDAITMHENVCGEWFVSDTRFGPFVHARLEIAGENSGKLVTLVRNKASEIAAAAGSPLVLIDGSPGIGCSVIASLTGCDYVAVVTEPSVAGLHDADRVIRTAEHFDVPAGVIINKFDLNEEIARRIEAYCRTRGLACLGKIPFDPSVIDAMIEGRTISEYSCGQTGREVRKVWDRVRAAVEVSV